MIENQVRYLCGIEWKESIDIKQLVDYFQKNNIMYKYILHNKDEEEDTKLKKEHYHLILKLGIKVRPSTFNNRLKGIFPNSFGQYQMCSSPHSYLNYMLHIGYTDKYQYSKEDIIGNLDILTIEYGICDDTQPFIDVMDIIQLNCLSSIVELINYLRMMKSYELLDYVITHISKVNYLFR